MPPEELSNDPKYRVRIDERVAELLEEKRPIGQSQTSYVNLLLQKAIINEPDRVIPREGDPIHDM